MLATFFLIGRVALAGPEPELAMTWRPTMQATTVMESDDPRDTFTVILEGDDTLLVPQLGRGEFAGWVPLAGPAGIYANVQGGTYALRLSRDADVKRGVDGLAGVGLWLDTPVRGPLSVRTRMGGRVYAWSVRDVPMHGNIGLVLGVEPRIGPVSLLAEGTLAAIGLLDDPAIGAQRDASSLRLRAAYGLPIGEQRVDVGVEMFHTKAEFQGTKAIAGGFAMDDLQVSATVGVVFRP